MAFVSVSPMNVAEKDIKIDIVGVPAVLGDPFKTWNTTRDHHPYQWLGPGLQAEIPSARVLLYDHLEPHERSMELKPIGHAEHKATSEAYAAVQLRLGQYGIDEWAERFHETVRKSRDSASLKRRPIVFICHSTGGVVVKRALTRKLQGKGETSLSSICLGIAFFGTPHHGSRVLSKLEFATPVKNKMNLRFEMSEHLQAEFALQHPELEAGNHRFGAASLGIKIWNYIETKDTQLKVLVSAEGGGEFLTKVNLLVVDDSSAKMTTAEVLIEEEDVHYMNTNHVGLARFADDHGLRSDFCEDLKAYIKSTSAQDRATHHALTTSIMTDIKVDVHQFYAMDVDSDAIAMGVWSVRPNLQDYLELGPDECLKTRLHPPTENGYHTNGNPKPLIKLRHASEVSAPAALETPYISITAPEITVATTTGDVLASSVNTKSAILDTPTIIPPKNIHTRRPPLNICIAHSDPDSANLLAPKFAHPPPTSAVFEHDYNNVQHITREPKPQRARTYQAPSRSTDRFRWVHIPYTHAGWVAPVLTTVSQEKKNMELHKKLLSDSVWQSQHNKARHASSHARFVRSACKSLLPKAKDHHNDELLSPTSSIDKAQLALYLPYLHWDNFDQLQTRATVIQKRGSLPHARPIDRDIAKGKSVECKLIWQYLNSNRPLHTLDQYGYPSLRNTAVRDADQVIYKQTRNPILPENIVPKGSPMHNIGAILRAARASGPRPNKIKTMSDGAAKVLMVDQLWLFVVDAETVVTFAAPKEKTEDPQSEQGDVRDILYKNINGDHANQCNDCYDFAALAVATAITALLDHTDDPNLQVFRIFEEYISELEFRDNHRLDVQYVDNRDDLNALLELRDVEDELGTIQKLFTEQHKTLKDMLQQYSELNTRYQLGLNGTRVLDNVDHCVVTYLEQIASMLKGAEVAQNAVSDQANSAPNNPLTDPQFEKLLDMKQKQANIVEAHLAREQTEVAADQSRSVMIFTIFTIIFLPLSFMASVFGMNVSQWSGVPSNIDAHAAFVYMGCISLAVIVVALLVAFNKYTRRILQRLWRKMAGPATRLLQRVPSERVHQALHYWDVERQPLRESPVAARERSRSRPGRPQTRGYEMRIFNKSHFEV
ncbi:hypothetical protein MMC13_002337 [Lambiella insularis]|nr:hypothetical protein [Lambiella insularis]